MKHVFLFIFVALRNIQSFLKSWYWNLSVDMLSDDSGMSKIRTYLIITYILSHYYHSLDSQLSWISGEIWEMSVLFSVRDKLGY